MTASIDLATCTEAELWRFVASHLEGQGIGVVLVGGAVVAVYTEGAYRSGDLDFVDQAALVVKAQPGDWKRIQEWCRAEGSGGPEAYEELRRLAS